MNTVVNTESEQRTTAFSVGSTIEVAAEEGPSDTKLALFTGAGALFGLAVGLGTGSGALATTALCITGGVTGAVVGCATHNYNPNNTSALAQIMSVNTKGDAPADAVAA